MRPVRTRAPDLFAVVVDRTGSRHPESSRNTSGRNVLDSYMRRDLANSELDEPRQHGRRSLACETAPLMIDSDQPRHVRTLAFDGRLDVTDRVAGLGPPSDPIEPPLVVSARPLDLAPVSISEHLERGCVPAGVSIETVVCQYDHHLLGVRQLQRLEDQPVRHDSPVGIRFHVASFALSRTRQLLGIADESTTTTPLGIGTDALGNVRRNVLRCRRTTFTEGSSSESQTRQDLAMSRSRRSGG